MYLEYCCSRDESIYLNDVYHDYNMGYCDDYDTNDGFFSLIHYILDIYYIYIIIGCSAIV